MLLLNSLAHFLVDGVCCSTIFTAKAAGIDVAVAILLYNTLAFSTQCLAGALLDRIGKMKVVNQLAILLVVLGWALPVGIYGKAALVGIGNSFFHVAAGMMTMIPSKGKARDLGIFVAPGAFGVTLGSLVPSSGCILAVLLVICGFVIGFLKTTPETGDVAPHVLHAGPERVEILPVILLTGAVAVRAIGGSVVSFPWKSGILLAFVLTLFVFLGKSLGGFLMDRIGPVRAAWVTVVPATICIAFFSASMIPSLAGQLLLNLTMPVTLFLLYQKMPSSPGLSFGLAASALWPGTLIGTLLTLTGPLKWICVVVSFLFGLVAILYSERKKSL